MYLKKNASSSAKGVYLTIAHAYRVDGKKKEKTIKKLGYLEDLKKDFDDPIAHFKEVIKQMNLADTKAPSVSIEIDKTTSIESTIPSINIGSAFIYQTISSLNIPSFMGSIQKKYDTDFKFLDVFRFLIYSRIIHPSSIHHAYSRKNTWIHSFPFSLQDTYRFLDYLLPHKDQLIATINQSINVLLDGRDVSNTYYDCTNYYFEIKYNDEDVLDDHGTLIKKGFRKKGACKDNSKKPIVGMGLVLDRDGIPLTYDLFEGNESEKLTLKPNINRVKREYQLDKIIVVADRGLNTSDNIFHNNSSMDGYIFSKSIRGADKEFKSWAIDNTTIDEDGDEIQMLKSRIHTFDITVRTNNRDVRQTVIQKQIVYYSKKYAERARHERDKVIEKANKLISNPGSYTSATSYGAAKYVNHINYDKNGEIINRDLSLKDRLIEEDKKYDGYYAIVTSEVEMSDSEIIETYRGLWKIEESFKVMKTEFAARPVYLSTDNHIKSHFLICYLSLVIMRLLQKQLNNEYSVRKIINAMSNYKANHLEGNLYSFHYYDEVLQKLANIYGFNLDKKYQERNEIKKFFMTPNKQK